MATLQGIKAKIRKLINSANAVTGNSDSDLTTAVNVLAAGYTTGDSTEYYRYVTFMDTDCETVASNVTVAPKYSCDRSVAPSITKESTIDSVYTLAGWSLTPDGPVQPGVLNSITENITLYPVFTSSVRYYTVRFFDGGTLLHTEKIPYHGRSTYTYKKIGAYFQGWNPAPVDIEGDMDCYGTWEFASFATDTWRQISQNSQEGNASQYYSVGDEREMTITLADGSTETVTLKIADIGLRTSLYVDGAFTTIDCISVLCITPPTDSYITYLGEQEPSLGISFMNSDMNDYLSALFERLPEELSLKIRAANVTTTRRYFGSTFTEVEHYPADLWPLTRSNIGSQYDAFELFDGTEESAKIMKLRNGEAISYWLADTDETSSSYAYAVSTDGSVVSKRRTDKAYVVFGFCI